MRIGCTEVEVEDYFYCELCLTYKDRPNEPMVCFQFHHNCYEPDETIDLHFCASCLEKCVKLIDGEQ